MGKLLTVRLNDADAATVERLRRSGVPISQFVREKLREAAAERNGHGRRKPKKSAAQLIAEIDARHPIPADAPHHGIDTTDRRAVSKYIRGRLLAKQERIQNDLARHERSRRHRRSA